MLIPNYLKDIIITDYLDQYTGKFKIKCLCGCEKFFLYKNIKKKVKISKEDRKRIKETEIWKDEVLWPLITNYGDCRKSQSAVYIDHPEDKYREIVVYDSTDLKTKFDIIKDKERIFKIFKVNYGEIPLSVSEINAIKKEDVNIIIKIKCSYCNREHILFDSRIHGCDAADFINNELEDYDFKELKINGEYGKSYNVNITIKNYWDNEESNNFNEACMMIDYSNLFNYIKIQVTNETIKKKIIFSEELG